MEPFGGTQGRRLERLEPLEPPGLPIASCLLPIRLNAWNYWNDWNGWNDPVLTVACCLVPISVRSNGSFQREHKGRGPTIRKSSRKVGIPHFELTP
jgi:hypothetical protein